MRQRRLDEQLAHPVLVFVPGQKPFHFRLDMLCFWSFEMNFFLSFRTGNNFHRTFAPGTRFYLAHSAAPGREQGRVPTENSFFGKRSCVVLCGFEHHLDDAVDVSVGGSRARGFETHATSERRPDALWI